jgi:hypothetical protein
MGNFLDFYGDKLGQFKAMPNNGLGVFLAGLAGWWVCFWGNAWGRHG